RRNLLFGRLAGRPRFVFVRGRQLGRLAGLRRLRRVARGRSRGLGRSRPVGDDGLREGWTRQGGRRGGLLAGEPAGRGGDGEGRQERAPEGKNEVAAQFAPIDRAETECREAFEPAQVELAGPIHTVEQRRQAAVEAQERVAADELLRLDQVRQLELVARQ